MRVGDRHHRVKVEFSLDGETLEGEEGEPIAAALVAAGKLALARSPKFHRPRGPSCFRGGCDGCLMRVDGEPNVMTCLRPLERGAVVSSQNTLGSRRFDLLRVTDWFFPQGLNHHELFAGIPGAAELMPKFARRVAGLGKLPDRPLAPREAARRQVDALVVGAGPAGVAAALALVERGRDVFVVDEGLEPGGGALALDAPARAPFASALEAFASAARDGRLRFSRRAAALAVFGGEVLVVGDDETSLLRARTTVLAVGAHDGVVPFEGNDLPGVMSPRAAGWLLARGVLPGERIVVISEREASLHARSYARAASDAGASVRVLERTKIARATGGARVKAVVVEGPSGGAEEPADTLLVDAPRSPAYELLEQAGARLEHAPFGFVPAHAGDREISPGFFALGECAGEPMDAAAYQVTARDLAALAG